MSPESFLNPTDNEELPSDDDAKEKTAELLLGTVAVNSIAPLAFVLKRLLGNNTSVSVPLNH
jgi:hypothetical protein